MQQKQIFYKSDFSAILSFSGGWSAPFRLTFWTNSPSRTFVASYDGSEYKNCALLSDGRLQIAFDNHNMGLGVLMLQPEFYLTNEAYNDHICNEVIKAFAPTFKDGNNVEYNVVLDMTGSSTMETIGTLPAYYQKGDKGDKLTYADLTTADKAELMKPATDAAVVATAAAKEARDATASVAADHAQAAADHTQATADHTQAGTDHSTATDDHTQAQTDHSTATTDHSNAASDHTQAGQDHTLAATDHTNAGTDHTQAATDHGTASADHTQSETDHSLLDAATQRANTDHNTATADHTQAQTDHTTAGEDHTQAGTDHTQAQTDHSTAASDHTQAQQTIASVEAAAGESALTDVTRDFGKYAAYPDKTLTLVNSGKRFDSTGALVDATGWAVGKLGAVVVGNTYELYMQSSEKMVLGTALFVAHTQETVGTEVKDVYTPLFSAKSTDIPASGYVCLEAMKAYEEVLVSYRTDVTGANVIKVRRYETKAEYSEKIGKLEDQATKAASDLAYTQETLDTVDDVLTPVPDYEALPLLCGQPPILFGAGTPQEAVVPTNWKQYDPQTNTGYQWNGQPSAVGQQYINTSASSGGRYIAVADANMNLTWKNF